MPLDYSKWAEVIREEDAAETVQQGQTKEWCAMTPEERRAGSLRAEEDERRLRESQEEHARYLQGLARQVEDADAPWMYDVDLDSYEDFTVKRTQRVVKARGADFFKVGEYLRAEHQWLGGLRLLQKVGLSWPTASELYVQLKCNLAQLYIKTERWAEARRVAAAALEVDPSCEKALFRRALAAMHFAEWTNARHDLERLLALHPSNEEAARRLEEASQALRRQSARVKKAVCAGEGPRAGLELSSAIEELTPDGTLRKLRVLVPGEDAPEGEDLRWRWPWGRGEWLGPAREKPVLTVHVVVCTVGGEELFSTRHRLVLPETPQERDELRIRMREVAELDDLAGKKSRTPADFCAREALMPMRWRYGDPCVYAGFELAARSMRLGERALFEIDQPLLEPSVCDFFRKDGGAARVAGLPDFRHHVEERKLNLLAEELTEWDLDLESKQQRTVRAELELQRIELFKDLSSGRTGEYLARIADAGRGGRRLKKGMKVMGDFVVASSLNGAAIYGVQHAVWILGDEGGESYVNRPGQRTVWIPACVGQLFRDATWQLLYEGTRLEGRWQAGPAPMELNPQLARDLSWKRAFGHRPPVVVIVDILQVLDD